MYFAKFRESFVEKRLQCLMFLTLIMQIRLSGKSFFTNHVHNDKMILPRQQGIRCSTTASQDIN